MTYGTCKSHLYELHRWLFLSLTFPFHLSQHKKPIVVNAGQIQYAFERTLWDFLFPQWYNCHFMLACRKMLMPGLMITGLRSSLPVFDT